MKAKMCLKKLRSIDVIKLLNLDFILTENGEIEVVINANTNFIFKRDSHILKCVNEISRELKKEILENIEEIEKF